MLAGASRAWIDYHMRNASIEYCMILKNVMLKIFVFSFAFEQELGFYSSARLVYVCSQASHRKAGF